MASMTRKALFCICGCVGMALSLEDPKMAISFKALPLEGGETKITESERQWTILGGLW
jgi:hypothetical protein